MAQTLTQQGLTVPAPRTGYALIDTGASVTCVDNQVAADLQLPVVDVAQMTSATHSNHPCNIHPILITIPPNVQFSAPRAMGAQLAPQGLIAIIGRDILQICTLFYNGAAGQITLSL
jgi:predicted aspartyl protease